ncbi:MAG TPA: serine/threonine-protein kinase [Thermoanaerobaculia bacterium]|nr:serine/threonine-protein kinase [Thermoanaerobaculia bacterium]HQP85015.1 serine/threonine-protein kinase [Thermoanaerobaculia bacterium]
MTALPDAAVSRLVRAIRAPDLSGTRYVLGREVGRGGMGSVWEAEDPELGRVVALKVLDLPDAAGDLAARLKREARVLARLEHPGVVPVHDVGTLPDGRPWYAMKLVRGDRLDAAAALLPTLRERLRLFLRVCEPVAFAHARGIVHRDLKPSNVMVGPFGEVLVLDWGIARLLDEEASERRPGPPAEPPIEPCEPRAGGPGTAAGTVLGTPGYMAPEQARGDGGVDARADVWALGVLLRGLAGPEALRARRLAAIVAKATAERPAERYEGAPALAADVVRYLDGEPVTAYRERPWERAARFAVRHRVALLLLLAYLAARAAVLLVYGR